MLLAAIKQREVDERTDTTDATVLQIIEKQIKQRRESATQFTAGGRTDLASQGNCRDRRAADLAAERAVSQMNSTH